MKLKSFNEYETYRSGNVKDITGKVQILGENISIENSPFVHIGSVKESNGSPILIFDNIKASIINESGSSNEHFYNSSNLNSRLNIHSKYANESFIPKSIRNRNKVRKLKFPIEAIGSSGISNYKTLNRFNNSENVYHTFREKINPRTKYEVLMFRDKPIDMVENINNTYTSKKINSDMLKKISAISNKINENHKLDVYYIKIYESDRNRLYLSGINKCNRLNEKQANLIYVKLYEDYYKHAVPTWFKNKINEIL